MSAFEAPHDPANESERQLAVDASGVIARTAANPSPFQELVDRAAGFFAAPMAVISIIDRQRQWFAARRGIEAAETPRELSFCAHAIHRPGEPLIVPDTLRDRRFAHHPAVLMAPHVRFYAGMPLVDRAGYPLGALCIADVKPRASPADIFELMLLAREAERLIRR